MGSFLGWRYKMIILKCYFNIQSGPKTKIFKTINLWYATQLNSKKKYFSTDVFTEGYQIHKMI